MTGLRCSGISPRRSEGLPGAWSVLLWRAVVVHPAGCGYCSPCCATAAVAFAFAQSNRSASGLIVVFVAEFPTAHSLA